MRSLRTRRPDGFGRVSSLERLAADRFITDLVGVVRPPTASMRPRPAPALPPPPLEHDPANAEHLAPGAVGPAVDGRRHEARIAILTPSGAFDGNNQARAIQPERQAFVEAFGRARHRVRLEYAPGEPSARHQDEAGYWFGGNDLQRVGTLTWGMFGVGIAGAVASAGGYGATRILDDLQSYIAEVQTRDWPRVRPVASQFPARRIVGFSDVTAVLLAAYSLLGWASLHGPMLCCHNEAALDRLVRAMTVVPAELDRGNPIAQDLAVVGPAPAAAVRGVLLGGNLSLVEALYGSPFFPSLKGGLLFVEDLNETGPKIDRMIEALKQRGAARQARAVVVGQVINSGISAEGVANLFRRSWNVPVVHRLPAGHGPVNQALWIGLPYELSFRARAQASLTLQA